MDNDTRLKPGSSDADVLSAARKLRAYFSPADRVPYTVAALPSEWVADIASNAVLDWYTAGDRLFVYCDRDYPGVYPEGMAGGWNAFARPDHNPEP